MKNKIYNISVILLIFLIFGCGQKEKQDKLNVWRIQSYYSPTDKINLSQFADSVELIFLETTDECMIQQLSHFKINNDRLYIGSANMATNKIFIFNENGNFESKIDYIGPGPEEYKVINDFIISTDSTVMVLTQEGTLLTYNIYNGMCESRSQLDIIPYNFVKKDDDLFLFHRGIRTSADVSDWTQESHALIQFDSSGEISTFYEPDDIMRNKIAYVIPIKTLYNFEDELYFTYSFCDTIFKIQDQTVTPHFYIDFGRNKIPNNIFINNPGIISISNQIRNKKCLFLLHDYTVTTSRLHYFFSDYEDNGYIAFYNKETDRTLIGHHIIDDLFFVGKRFKMKPWDGFFLIDDDYLIWSIDSSKAKEMYEGYKKDPDKWKEFEAKYGQYIPQLEKIEPEDNPILFKVKLKSYI